MKDKFLGKECLVYHKYDGSNIRVEWNKKQGFYKFGTRTRLLSLEDPVFGGIPDLFREKHSDWIEKIIVDKYKSQNSVVFFEFFGENSFAGSHVESDEKKLILIDVSIYKKGIINPWEFERNFGLSGLSAFCYGDRIIGESLIEWVSEKQSIFAGLNEGVVCKGLNFACKIKTNEWKEKLMRVHSENWRSLV